MNQPMMQTLARRLDWAFTFLACLCLSFFFIPPGLADRTQIPNRSITGGGLWTVEWTFENGTVGSTCQGAGGTGPPRAGAEQTVSTVTVHGGSKSCQTRWPGPPPVTNGNGYGWTCCAFAINYDAMGLRRPKKGDEIWIRVWFYQKNPWSWEQYCDENAALKNPPCGTTNQANVVKRFRLNERSASGTRVGDGDNFLYDTGDTVAGITYWFEVGSGRKNPNQGNPGGPTPRDQWYCVEVYQKLDEGGAGVSRLWIGNNLIIESVEPTIAEAGSTQDDFELGSHWNGGPTQIQYEYWDDVKMTIDPAQATQTDSKGNKRIGCQ